MKKRILLFSVPLFFCVADPLIYYYLPLGRGSATQDYVMALLLGLFIILGITLSAVITQRFKAYQSGLLVATMIQVAYFIFFAFLVLFVLSLIQN